MGTMAKAYGAEIIGVSKVPAGTTDFQQFVLAAQDGGAEGVIMPLGNNEAVQVMQAAQQFGHQAEVLVQPRDLRRQGHQGPRRNRQADVLQRRDPARDRQHEDVAGTEEHDG